MQPFDLATQFIVIDPDLACTQVAVGPSLYEDLDRDFAGFRQALLVSEYTFEQDWPSWEMHPAGDEVLYLIAGRATILLYCDGVESQLELDQPGRSVIIPKGHWHTARVAQTTTLVFITPGEGTQNGPDPRLPPATGKA